MKRLISGLAAGALALSSLAMIGVTAAGAAPTAPTIKLADPKAVYGVGPYTITATASVAGTVQFTLGGTALTGCNAVATLASGTNFIATCSWTPTAVGSVSLGATLTPTDTTNYTSASTTLSVNVVAPVQGNGPLNVAFSVDTVQGSGSTSIKPPVGCAQTNEFYVGQQVVFRMSAVNIAAGGVPLTSANTVSAVITIPGVTTPIPMSFGSHGTAAFWTGAWATAGYATMGVVNFTITVTTAQVPAVTKSVAYKARVKSTVKGKVVYRTVIKHKTVIVKPAVAGQTATFTQAGFSPTSQLTLNPLPTA